MGQNEGRLLDFRDSIERDKKSFPTLNMHYSSQKGKNDLEGNSETIRSGMPTTDPGDIQFSSMISEGKATSSVSVG